MSMLNVFPVLAAFQRSSIFVLRACCSPFTVVRGIWSIVVDPIDRKTWRASTHVREKVFVRVPTFANGDAATAIVYKVFVGWVVTSFFNSAPCFIFSRWLTVGCLTFSVYAIGFSPSLNAFKFQASAGACVACTQIMSTGFNFITAVAAAEPKEISAFVPIKFFNDGQSIIPVACDINENGHSGLLTGG